MKHIFLRIRYRSIQASSMYYIMCQIANSISSGSCQGSLLNGCYHSYLYIGDSSYAKVVTKFLNRSICIFFNLQIHLTGVFDIQVLLLRYRSIKIRDVATMLSGNEYVQFSCAILLIKMAKNDIASISCFY